MEGFKAKGVAAFKQKNYEEAIEMFSKAIELDSKNVSLIANRSFAHLKQGQFSQALLDANLCIKTDPDWAKGYVRKGNVLLKQQKYREAQEAYDEGLQKSPDAGTRRQLEAGIRAVQKNLQGQLGNVFGNIFGKDMWAKLAVNPETRAYLDDPDTVAKLKQLENSPNPFANPEVLRDPKISKCFQVLLGGMGGFGGGGAAAGDAGAAGSSDAGSAAAADAKAAPKPAPRKAPEPEPAEELTEEEKKAKEVRERADVEKDKGNDLYKAKKFDEAIAAYASAFTIDSSNYKYLNNQAAVYMSKKDFKQAISTCEEALKVAFANNEPYAAKAKMYTRIGKCYNKLKDYKAACEYFQKSLDEDRNDTADRLLRQTQDYIRKIERRNYIDPAKSEESMKKGREYAGAKKWREAIEEFSEAFKRDPKNYKALSNRAFVYQKIMDWNNAISDCEKVQGMAPDFVKIYIRQARINRFLKVYHRAVKALQIGMSKPNATDREKAEMTDLKRQVMMDAQNFNAQGGEEQKRAQQKALEDPEIRGVTNDPVIAQVLEKMQSDPTAARRALADPAIASKLELLIAAGILRTG